MVGSNFCTVFREGEPFFIIGGDNFIELFACGGFPVCGEAFEEVGDYGPTLVIENEVDFARVVTKDEAEKFAQSGGIHFLIWMCR